MPTALHAPNPLLYAHHQQWNAWVVPHQPSHMRHPSAVFAACQTGDFRGVDVHPPQFPSPQKPTPHCKNDRATIRFSLNLSHHCQAQPERRKNNNKKNHNVPQSTTSATSTTRPSANQTPNNTSEAGDGTTRWNFEKRKIQKGNTYVYPRYIFCN